jgi:tRNA nucleotidyltransferase (CCA-adding enzyme)
LWYNWRMDIIQTHANTDFDGLAAMLAAAKLYPGSVPVLARTLNRNVRDFLALYRDELPFCQPDDAPKGAVNRLILVDTQGYSAPKGMHAKTAVLILDHHPLDHPSLPLVRYEGEPTGSTTAFLVHRLREQFQHLSPSEASLLLLGIYEDTGNLSYTTTTARDVLAAGWLLERGASLDVVNDFMHRPLASSQRELYEILERQAVAHDILGQSVIIASARTSEYVEELSSVAHKLNELFDPDASFVIVQVDSHIQVIARSRSEEIDVAAIVRPMGGGGHSKAAAALVRDKTPEQVETDLLTALRQHVRPQLTVREVMSKGIHTLSPQMPMAEAASLMQRWGHEGFPVAQEGRLLGMLTRREVDRAMQHRLGTTPVSSYMRKGSFAVTADEAMTRVRQLMIEHDLGQIPVVDGDRIVGIVTRTDVIRLISAPREGSHPPLGERVKATLPPGLLDTLKQASQMAADMGFSLYLVGGFVRDLLLGKPTLDLDLVVEGDAILLAKRLTGELGGTLRVHARFGTAKWQAPGAVSEGEKQGGARPGRPLTLDFVTARTEFYEHPEALPTVEASSLRQDLYRRDFTINTMALRLDKQRFGELVDFYGGEKDSQNRLIRVLHNLSFVEDATRMLRAVRLEQRLGFSIERRTEELMLEARDLLGRVSGERLRHELYLVLEEAEPEPILRRLHQLGILGSLCPGLQFNQRVAHWFREASRGLAAWADGTLQAGSSARGVLPAIYLALLTHDLSEDELENLLRRLCIVTERGRIVREAACLHRLVGNLSAAEVTRSAIYRMLTPFSLPAIYVLWLTEGEPVRGRLELFARELRHARPRLNGHVLTSLGAAPGPEYRSVLAAILDAQLDGRVGTLAGEQAMARQLLGTG